MATEKHIYANRGNASTGLKTAAGKLKASRNAFRHGLSHPLPFDPLVTTRVEAIAQFLTSGETGAAGRKAASEWAEAHLELLRVRHVQMNLWANIDTSAADTLHCLARIDRYEAQALSRRRRAVSSPSGILGPVVLTKRTQFLASRPHAVTNRLDLWPVGGTFTRGRGLARTICP